MNDALRPKDCCPTCGQWARVARKGGLTRRQADCLDFIKFYMEDSDGLSPSYEDIMVALDLKSKSGVHRLVAALEERGRIVRLPNRSRAIMLLEYRPL